MCITQLQYVILLKRTVVISLSCTSKTLHKDLALALQIQFKHEQKCFIRYKPRGTAERFTSYKVRATISDKARAFPMDY